VFFEVSIQVVEGFDVGRPYVPAGVGDEDEPSRHADQFAAGVVETCPGRYTVNARLEAAHRAEDPEEEVEEESSISFGGKRDHLALLLLGVFSDR